MRALGSVLLALAPFLYSGIVPWTSQESFVPRMRDAQAQLDHARRLKEKLVGADEEEGPFWRKLAVEAYQAVRDFHPAERAVAAEAAFRAGELLRAAGEVDPARREFSEAFERGKGTEFRARAQLEIGHLERRRGALRAALDAYLKVTGDPRARRAHRDDGWYWAGRVWDREDRHGDARRAFRQVAEGKGDPLDRLRAYDALGCSWIARDDPEAAAGVLDECVRALAPFTLQETEEGLRVRNGLLRMRLVEDLRRAIRRRKRSRDENGSSRNP